MCRICCCWASCLCTELKLFKENNGGSPEYTINMCFGEKFPDGKALEKKLVTVKVRLLSNSLPSEMHEEFNSRPLLAPAGGSSDMSTLPWDGPFGGSVIASQLQRQPADLTQQPLRSHQLCVRTAGAAGAGEACCGFSTTDLIVSHLVLILRGGGADPNPSQDKSNRPPLPPYGSCDTSWISRCWFLFTFTDQQGSVQLSHLPTLPACRCEGTPQKKLHPCNVYWCDVSAVTVCLV